MNKKTHLLISLGLALSCASALLINTHILNTKAIESGNYYVDFFNNYLRQDFTLSNGTTGKGNNIIYKTVQVNANSLVNKPEDPTRKNYDFLGWYLEEACENAWDFNADKVTKNTRLFAKWAYSTEQEDGEPIYTPPSTVLEESASSSYIIDSVMYFPITNNEVKLPRAALAKLAGNSDNVLPFMEYRVKSSKTISATYSDNKIIINCSGETREIAVKDDTISYTLSNSSYEDKAKKYEAKALEEENYHVMLAGSSSIEFWTSSKEDLDPIISYNHGIGGTTIEEWDECLNQRLVFPAKPKMVVYYVGINNVINSKESSTVIWNKLEAFLNHTHEALPNTQVQYIMMNRIPGFTSYFSVIDNVNSKVTEFQRNNSWLTLINPGTALLKKNGIPNVAYFRTDGLHLSLYGYVVWGGIVKKSIVEGLERL